MEGLISQLSADFSLHHGWHLSKFIVLTTGLNSIYTEGMLVFNVRQTVNTSFSGSLPFDSIDF